jgi:alkane 1-monooxygenase
MKALPYAFVSLAPLCAAAGLWQGGYWFLLTPVMLFGIIPTADALIGSAPENYSPSEATRLDKALSFRLLTWLCVPVQLGLVLWAVSAAPSFEVWEQVGLAFAVGISSGVMGINVSHELVHRTTNRLEPALGRLMLWSTLYLHWAVEHVAGHHRWVATPRDPATARLGESVYAFLPRTIAGGLRSAWTIETQRLTRLASSPKRFGHRIARYLVLEVLTIGAVWLGLGPGGALFFVGQAIVAILLLEVVNYIEHYGLVRPLRADGSYGPVGPEHSWNSSAWLTNHILFNLQRHADHHRYPGRRYHMLRHFESSPQLPAGYATMLLVALVPPLWRRVMDTRVRRETQEVAASPGQ